MVSFFPFHPIPNDSSPPSRLKKIKCLQPSPEAKCEACKSAKIPCRFRDRERYFAERSRAIAGPNSGVYASELRSVAFLLRPPSASYLTIRSESNPALDGFSVASGSSSPSVSSQSDPRSNSHSPKASGMVSAEVDNPARYSSYHSDSRHSMGASHRYVLTYIPPISCLLTVKSHSSSISSFDSLRSNNGIPYNFGGHAPSPQMLHYPANSRPNSYQQDQRSIQLFDAENHQRPHPGLMTHFIQVFFERFGPDFPFLQYQDILADFWEQRLSLIVANCVAAMAVKCAVPHCLFLLVLLTSSQTRYYSRFVDPRPSQCCRKLYRCCEGNLSTLLFLARTSHLFRQNLLSAVAHIPSLETLHGLMLLCWFEHSHHRLPGKPDSTTYIRRTN